MKIILIGYRATGKSTVGLLLSGKLNVPFVDTDRLIEDAAGMPVNALITRLGWEAFREKETEAIASLRDMKVCVVATGGGAVLSGANRQLLQEMGIRIYLKAPLQDIVERLQKDAQTQKSRPQFTSGNLVEETAAVLKERAPVYEASADFTVDTVSKSIVRVTEEIYQHLLESGIVSDINKLKRKEKNKH